MKKKFIIIIALLLVAVSCQVFTGCELPDSSDNEHGLTDEELETVSNRLLVPQLISYDRFEEEILTPLKETFGDALYEPATTMEIFNVQSFLVYYSVFAKEDLGLSEDNKYLFGVVFDNLIASDGLAYEQTLNNYPAIDHLGAICVFNPKSSIEELAHCEEIIKTYCPNYTYADLYYDYALTDYDYTKSPAKGNNEQYDYIYFQDSQTCTIAGVKADSESFTVPLEIDGYKVVGILGSVFVDIESITFEGTKEQWWEICSICPVPVHCSDGTIESGQIKPEYEPVTQ